jgi:hypothetical protein
LCRYNSASSQRSPVCSTICNASFNCPTASSIRPAISQALARRAYSEHRSTLAKQLGLGRKPKAEAAATPVAAQPPVGDAEERVEADHPTSGAATRSGSEPDAVEAASQPTRRRQRRARSPAAPTYGEQPAGR